MIFDLYVLPYTKDNSKMTKLKYKTCKLSEENTVARTGNLILSSDSLKYDSKSTHTTKDLDFNLHIFCDLRDTIKKVKRTHKMG